MLIPARLLLLAALCSSTCVFAQTQPSTRPTTLPALSVADVALEQFAAWDANADETLQEAELDRVLLDPETRGNTAAAAAALKNYVRQEATAKHDVLLTREHLNSEVVRSTKRTYKLLLTATAAMSLGNLDAATTQPSTQPATQPTSAPATQPVTTKNVLTPQGLFDRSRRALASPVESLYGQTDGAERTTPDFAKLRQGNFGDCYLIAVLGARTQIDAGDMAAMISPSPSDPNMFTVTWGDASTTTTPLLTQGEIALGGASTAGGLWVRVIEKALTLRKLPEDKRDITLAADAIGKGGNPRQMIQLITGKRAAGYNLFAGRREPPTEQAVSDRLEIVRPVLVKAMSAKRIATLSTPTTATPPPGMSPKHAYAVIGYDEATDVLKVWNPHANTFKPKLAEGAVPDRKTGYPTQGGIFEIPFTDAAYVFSSLSLETEETLDRDPFARPATRPATQPTTRPTTQPAQ